MAQAILAMSSDEELMAEVARGGVQALAGLFERHRQGIFGFCYRLLGESSAAEDAVQDVFLRIYDRRKTFRPGAKFLPWLYAIARNLCMDRLKSARHREVPMSQIEMEVPDGVTHGQSEASDHPELAGAVRDAVNTLSDEMRMTVILREYQGLNYREIATVMGCSEEAVRVRMHRARLALRKILSAYL